MGVSDNRGVPYFGVLIIRILLVRVLYLGPLFSETTIYILEVVGCRAGAEYSPPNRGALLAAKVRHVSQGRFLPGFLVGLEGSGSYES